MKEDIMAKKLFTAILLISCLLCAQASAVSLEQVQPVMPDISVFVHSDGQDLGGLAPSSITATLDGEPLTVGDFAESDEGIFYVFMLDISRSISQNYLDAAKQAVLNTYQQMRQQDQLAVITFGDAVTVLLDGSESAQVVSEKLAAVKATDSNTQFYAAMDTLIKTASAKTDMRRCAVVVSDGVEDAQSDMTQEELETTLRQGGVAVYALAVDSASAGSIKTFRSFVDVSGGELFEFSPDDAQSKLSQLLQQIDEIWQLNLKAGSNIADGTERALSVKFGDLGEVTAQIKPNQWTPDDTPPYVLSLAADETAGTITVKFSEAMTGLDNPNNYKLLSPEGKETALTLSSAGADTVTLAASGFTRDGWKLALSGLTDASMEKNTMPDRTLPLSGQLAEDAAKPGVTPAPAEADSAGGLSPLLMIVIAAAAVAVLAAALVALKKRGKKEEPAASAVKHVFTRKEAPESAVPTREDTATEAGKKAREKASKKSRAEVKHVFTARKKTAGGDAPKFFFDTPSQPGDPDRDQRKP